VCVCVCPGKESVHALQYVRGMYVVRDIPRTRTQHARIKWHTKTMLVACVCICCICACVCVL